MVELLKLPIDHHRSSGWLDRCNRQTALDHPCEAHRILSDPLPRFTDYRNPWKATNNATAFTGIIDLGLHKRTVASGNLGRPPLGSSPILFSRTSCGPTPEGVPLFYANYYMASTIKWLKSRKYLSGSVNSTFAHHSPTNVSEYSRMGISWSGRRDSNPRPPGSEAGTLPV